MSALTTAPPSRRPRANRLTLAVHHAPDADEPPTVPDVPRPGVPTDPAAVVVALADRREAVVPLVDLAADLGIPEADAARLADEAAACGWLARWAAPGDDGGGTVASVTLSPLSAEAAGLELDETGQHWRPVGTRSKVDPDPWRAKRGRTFVNLATDYEDASRTSPGEPNAAAALEVIAHDYRELEPWDAADDILTAERIAAINAARDAARQAGGPRLPRLLDGPVVPRLILGLGIAWPPRWEAGSPCPGCGSTRLPALAYCTVCDSTSNEARTDADAARHAEAITTPPRPAPVAACAADDARPADVTPAVVDAPEGLLGGLERLAPTPPTGRGGRKARPGGSAAVMVKLLRPMSGHAAGDVIGLRPSIAAAYVTVGAAMPVGGH